MRHLSTRLVKEFRDYIYSFIDEESKEKRKEIKSPEELLDEVGYILYECKSEDDIQNFRKYYANDEKICTFKGGRLIKCRVFFAVKKNVDEIKREDFSHPTRQDLYGTSVISIQFSKDPSHSLSIKNRYNHIVKNPDATFFNNLDNIVSGLTESFEKYYGMVQTKVSNVSFELPDYIRAADGKFYKYNYKIKDVFYCPNSIIIDNFEVKRYEKERFLIIDYFILDLKEKKLSLYNNSVRDSFPNSVLDIEKIEVSKKGEYKILTILTERGTVLIVLDRDNNIIGLKNDFITEIYDEFLCLDTTIREIELPKVEKIWDDFLFKNQSVKRFEARNLKAVGSNFFCFNINLKELILPSIESIGNYFLCMNEALEVFDLKNLSKDNVGYEFLFSNNKALSLFLEQQKDKQY